MFKRVPHKWTDGQQTQGAHKNPSTTLMIMSKMQATSIIEFLQLFQSLFKKGAINKIITKSWAEKKFNENGYLLWEALSSLTPKL